jgi:hypothetical protein
VSQYIIPWQKLWQRPAPQAHLLKEVFPSVPHKRSFGPHETLLAIEKARKILGYNPKYSWRPQNHDS